MKVVGRKYANVSELVHDTAEPEFAAEFDKYQAERQLANCLTVMRCAHETTQAHVAEAMGCAQSKVSKMESSADADLNVGDVVAYATALKQTVHLTFMPATQNRADHIRFHARCIKHELEQLVKVAGDDRLIGDGVEAFAIQQVQDMMAMVERSLDRLPHRIQRAKAGVSIEVEGDRGQRLEVETSKPTRRAPRKAGAGSKKAGVPA